MAVDEALLEACRLGLSPPSLRFTRWQQPTLTLGYAQRLDGIPLVTCAELGIELVRRPTGGRAVLHSQDFTYAVVAPGLPDSVSGSYREIASALRLSLSALGVGSALEPGKAAAGRSPDCFANATQADLCALGRKLIGSAQTRRAGTVLQHGSLYLSAPVALAAALFPGNPPPVDLARVLGTSLAWDSVAAAFVQGFAAHFGGEWTPGELSAWERARAERTVQLNLPTLLGALAEVPPIPGPPGRQNFRADNPA
jgi:lipoate-protein ligase A